MTRQIVELDSLTLEWGENAMRYIQDLSDDFLLLQTVLEDLEKFCEETYSSDAPKAPKTLRRSIALLKRLSVSQEFSVDELRCLCCQLQRTLKSF